MKIPRKMKKAFRKLDKQVVGFSGCGPTAFDSTKGPRVTWKEKRKYAHVVQQAQDFKKDCFRQACIEVLGEDPNDWL